MVRMQIQFTEEQARALKRVAAERHLSIAALTREAVERLLVENGDSTSAESRAKVMAIMGKFRSGRSDIASNHDDYLADVYAEHG